MKPNNLYFCFFLLAALPAIAQKPDLNGTWKGYVIQDAHGFYYTELHLTAKSDSTFMGTSFFSCDRGEGTIGLNATFKGKTFRFQETEVVSENWKTTGWYWCIKQGKMTLRQTKDSLIMEGTWEAGGGCYPGTIRVAKALALKKAPEKAPAPITTTRKIEEKETLKVAENEIIIEIWDNENEDGDIASLDLNGVRILDRHKVTLKKQRLRVTLQQGNNQLVLFAENLGKRPPNTAAISIFDGKSTRVVVLNSDIGKSEAVNIVVE